jgi:DNA processing protein
MHKIPLEALPIRTQTAIGPPPHIYSSALHLPQLLQDRICICIVGSRRPTEYGKRVTHELVQALADLPCTIVSGLAYGIDSYALQAAVDAQIPAIGVPGSGVKSTVIYPRASAPLAQSITDRGGALVTQFEPDAQSQPWMFPVRNKLMAALCHAVVIIEADHKSGSLITAFHALEFNRDIFAVPGSIFSPLSHGTHNLIKHGATPVTSIETLRTYILEHPCLKQKIIHRKVTNSAPTQTQNNDPLSTTIVNVLKDGPTSLNSIMQTLEQKKLLAEHDIYETLLNLELKGIITLSAGQYELAHTPLSN